MKIIVAIRVWAVMLSCSFLGVYFAAAQQGGADIAGSQIVQKACAGCHDLNLIYQSKKSAEQWDQTVNEMIRKGAPLLGNERRVLVEFLAKNYGSDPSKTSANSMAAQPATNTPSESASDAQGRDIVRQACSLCHALEYIYSARRSAAEWEVTVNDMIGRGAPLLAEDRRILVQFLAKYYGSEKSKTNINKASAEQLATIFGLSQMEATEITRFRQQNGTIHGWEDLRKIPKLDLKKLEVKRDILAFL